MIADDAQKLIKSPTAAKEEIIDEMVSDLMLRYRSLSLLAMGGYEQVTEIWKPAGLLMVGRGDLAMKAFPDKDDEELVCVERKVSFAAPDFAANKYLVDHVLGSPVQKAELKLPGGASSTPEQQELEAAQSRLAEWREIQIKLLSELSAPEMPLTSPTTS